MRVAVIGAGAAGLTAAYELSKRDVDVVVYEANEAVGGLGRSISLWDQTVDLGPHRFFSSDPRVNRLWLEVVGRDYRMIDRLTRIYYRSRFFHYPLKPVDALRNIGLVDAALCTWSYAKEKLNTASAEEETFESWVVSRFGRRLFETFFRSYTEKLWGIPCSELDADFAKQRIKKFSLGEALKSALGAGGERHKTLVDRFAYPTGGTGMVYERMADRIRERGGQIHVGTPVKRVVHDGRDIQGLMVDGGTFETFDHVVSTMPLTLLVRGLGDIPPEVQRAVEGLRFRNTILVYLQVNADDLFPDQWLYVHSPELRMGRVTNYRNWVPSLYGDASSTILCVEFWCYNEEAIWKSPDQSLIQRAEREMRSTGLVSEDQQVLDGRVIRLHRCYPVYDRGYKENLARIVAYLRGFTGLTPIGRYGAFKYNNQDHSILMGILAAENITENRGHDIWSVNTDYTYQEEALITETGLSKVGAPYS